MRMVDLIIKKRDGYKLNKEEIDFIIKGYVNNQIPDYQISSLLMAIFFKGMDIDETVNLTYSMLNSGDTIDLSKVNGITVDKHSTGGVGDKTTLVVAPLVASLGLKVAKMSGRGLGHTGGTLDKLESIPGYNINISNDSFIKQVNEIGLSVIGQSKSLVPADKLLYALRDVCGCVDSIPLIASSIMSKKIAAGSDVISLDVKVGSGAFMKNLDDAKKIANLMVLIGNKMNKKVHAILTNMDEPLGYAIGNSLEVIEAINTLNGNGPKDLLELSIECSANLAKVSGMDYDIAKEKLYENIKNKKALEKLALMVKYQGGDESFIYNPEKFSKTKYVIDVKSDKEGYIVKMNAKKLGIASMKLKAGREKKDDTIDYSAGIVLFKKINDYVNVGDTIMQIHSNVPYEESIKLVKESIILGKDKTDVKLILDIIGE